MRSGKALNAPGLSGSEGTGPALGEEVNRHAAIGLAAVDAADTLLGTPGKDVLVGGDGDDVLFGFAGNDVLNGGKGANKLYGGPGDDTYQLRYKDAVNLVVELADGGTDTVASWTSHSLSPWVENLQLRSTVNWQYGRGNDLDNIITAGAGIQALDGLGGDDTLTGGAGVDAFSFGAGSGADRITDFEPGVDRILIWEPEIRSYQDLLARMQSVGGDVRIDLGPGRSVLIEDTLKEELDAETFLLEPLPAEMIETFSDDFDRFDPSSGGPWSKGSGRGNPHDIWYRGSPDNEQIYVTSDYAGTGDASLGLNPFSLRNGVLTISATRAPDALVPELLGKEWISGRLTSYETFEQRYGYFRDASQAPGGPGILARVLARAVGPQLASRDRHIRDARERAVRRS